MYGSRDPTLLRLFAARDARPELYARERRQSHRPLLLPLIPRSSLAVLHGEPRDRRRAHSEQTSPVLPLAARRLYGEDGYRHSNAAVTSGSHAVARGSVSNPPASQDQFAFAEGVFATQLRNVIHSSSQVVPAHWL